VKKLIEVNYAFKQLQITTMKQKYQEQQHQTPQERTLVEHETMKTILMGSKNLCITQEMLWVDEAT